MTRFGMKYVSSTPLNYNLNGGVRTIKIIIGDEEKEYFVESCDISSQYVPEGFGFTLFRSGTVYNYDLVEVRKAGVKTEERIAAEESVAKAKEALKAAENALKAIKEKK